jgi:SNF2 family DNA or RNA helicase
MLDQLFHDREDALDEETVVKSATGIRNTVVWKKLFKFQRDGVIGAIEKLDRFGGCIIADSVGLGKTFEALAIIKYYELRNDRVLVLVPSACATTGRSTRSTIVATSSPPTASTMTSSTTRDLSRDTDVG